MKWLNPVTLLGNGRVALGIQGALNSAYKNQIIDKKHVTNASRYAEALYYRINMIDSSLLLLIELEQKVYESLIGYDEKCVFSNENKDACALELNHDLRYQEAFLMISIMNYINTFNDMLEDLIKSILAGIDEGLSRREKNDRFRKINDEIIGNDDSYKKICKKLDDFRNYDNHQGAIKIAYIIKDNDKSLNSFEAVLLIKDKNPDDVEHSFSTSDLVLLLDSIWSHYRKAIEKIKDLLKGSERTGSSESDPR